MQIVQKARVNLSISVVVVYFYIKITCLNINLIANIKPFYICWRKQKQSAFILQVSAKNMNEAAM